MLLCRAAANSRFHIFCARLENAIMFCLHHKISRLEKERERKSFTMKNNLSCAEILEGFVLKLEKSAITIPFPNESSSVEKKTFAFLSNELLYHFCGYGP